MNRKKCPKCRGSLECFCRETQGREYSELEFLLVCEKCGTIDRKVKPGDCISVLDHWLGVCPFCDNPAKKHQMF